MRERKTGNFYALKCVKKKQLHHSNLENEIKVLKRYETKQDTNTTGQITNIIIRDPDHRLQTLNNTGHRRLQNNIINTANITGH